MFLKSVRCGLNISIMLASCGLCYGLYGCSTNTENNYNEDHQNDISNNSIHPAATRPVTDSPAGWDDTPANQPIPNLGAMPTQGAQHCAQDKHHIYGNEAGCLFSIESYKQGQSQTLTCINNTPYVNDAIASELKVGHLSLSCDPMLN